MYGECQQPPLSVGLLSRHLLSIWPHVLARESPIETWRVREAKYANVVFYITYNYYLKT